MSVGNPAGMGIARVSTGIVCRSRRGKKRCGRKAVFIRRCCMHTGSCLCGGIKFEINEKPGPIQICHCGQCRKAQGSAFVTNVPVQESNFKFISGMDLLGSFESSPGKRRYFCKVCGSPVYSKTEKRPGVVRIRAGTLDGELETKPIAHFYVAYKANWYEITDNLPQFTEGFVPKTKDQRLITLPQSRRRRD